MILLLGGVADIAPDSSSSLAEDCFRAEEVGRKGRVGEIGGPSFLWEAVSC